MVSWRAGTERELQGRSRASNRDDHGSGKKTLICYICSLRTRTKYSEKKKRGRRFFRLVYFLPFPRIEPESCARRQGGAGYILSKDTSFH
jgi:hypothetical protein